MSKSSLNKSVVARNARTMEMNTELRDFTTGEEDRNTTFEIKYYIVNAGSVFVEFQKDKYVSGDSVLLGYKALSAGSY